MSSGSAEERQGVEWKALYERIKALLARWGVEDAFGKGDYLIFDDNYGFNRQSIEIHKLSMLKVPLIQQLRSLLVTFPGWEIVIAVDIPGNEHWPPMGFTIRNKEIIDGLRREYLPEELRFFKIPGSRPGTGYD